MGSSGTEEDETFWLDEQTAILELLLESLTLEELDSLAKLLDKFKLEEAITDDDDFTKLDDRARDDEDFTLPEHDECLIMLELDGEDEDVALEEFKIEDKEAKLEELGTNDDDILLLVSLDKSAIELDKLVE